MLRCDGVVTTVFGTMSVEDLARESTCSVSLWSPPSRSENSSISSVTSVGRFSLMACNRCDSAMLSVLPTSVFSPLIGLQIGVSALALAFALARAFRRFFLALAF